jgi:hypothetical protein
MADDLPGLVAGMKENMRRVAVLDANTALALDAIHNGVPLTVARCPRCPDAPIYRVPIRGDGTAECADHGVLYPAGAGDDAG